ncbi:unnamed protein product [Kluyveromyces dobzhanskii CBS 2104]|uniref:WGS project CCBQ000000000 data, contig 00102 n=1 Tax=Kluyveromyces dobzhanskii CBS 2104 TaxID=1427455 RepID=A0A0A8L4P6_9SACH|nr:unnamed protein product [Kluyveromyces dobzhanskii CBS 2104]
MSKVVKKSSKVMPNSQTVQRVSGSQAVDKLSKIQLSAEQTQLKTNVFDFIKSQLSNYSGKPSMYVIEGDAGTGKSVILNALFNDLQKQAMHASANDVLKGTRNYLVVNHPEMLKLYHQISRSFPYIKKSSLERPTSVINNLRKTESQCDAIIVDEAHLLATSKDAFKRFYGDNHLKDLMELSKVLIVVFDAKQSLRMGSYWDDEPGNGSTLSAFYESLPAENKKWYRLKQQFRVVAEKDTLDWIQAISTEGKIPSFPESVKSGQSKFDFKIWDDCGAMYHALKDKNDQYGQCRVLATYDFPYRLDGKDYFVECGDNFKVRWDRYAPRAILPWSERDDTFEEVGSVYTIQGFDLNWAGVILGRSVGYDAKTDSIKLKPEFYDDHAGFTKKKNIRDVDKVKTKIIMNSINVLLTRGVKGLYIYAWDPELRERLSRI